MAETPLNHDWWASLRHGGLLIAPSRILEFFPENPEPLPAWLEERLRRDISRADDPEGQARLLDTVLEKVLGLGAGVDWDSGAWAKGGALSAEWTRRSVTGEALRPRRVWQGPRGAVLPVFFDDQGKRLGVGKGRRAAARVVEWLRRTEQRLALLTNARQFRLVYAGLDHEAWAEWDTDLWFQEGQAGPQVEALRALLSRRSLVPGQDGQPSRLHAAIEASRKGQAELSSVLGERVRQAVEILIREYGPALARLQDDGVSRSAEVDGCAVSGRDIYRAATRVMMRMVVLLFSEALDLLPRENAIYHEGYSLQGLREALDRVAPPAGTKSSAAPLYVAMAERLRSRAPSAWPRVLALFRLVYEGSPHEALPVRRYGGALFEPGDPTSADPIRRALAVLEDPGLEHIPSDAAVRNLLELLTRSKVRVRQGNRSVWIEAPVDFADLSSEYIGILYEGLLDFELRHVAQEDPVVFLALGDEPALPLSRLEAMDEAALRSLVEKFRTTSRAATADEGDAGDEETAEDEDEAPGQEPETEEEAQPETDLEEAESQDDRRRAARERAVRWALRVVDAGRMVRRPTSRRPEALARYEQDREAAARGLVRRVVLPGEWYLVRFGGTRKGSGTFYTRPQLAIPTVQRTLQPLAFCPPEGREEAPRSEWTVRSPEELLALKVCDPACGSGSFLIASLRYLAEALWESLLQHRWLTRVAEGAGRPTNGDRLEATLEETARPPWFAQCVRDMPVDAEDAEGRVRARVRRHVVERCLYGVDMDPLAVELCRVALWVETMDRDLPFTFLDHKVKCGNSLVGCWLDRFADYPTLAWEREGGDRTHTNGVHHHKEAWHRALAAFRSDRLKPALAAWIATLGRQGLMDHALEGIEPESAHEEAVLLFERLHGFEVTDTEAQARFYRLEVQGSPALRTLRQAFDHWCAAWFWPADRLDEAPLPGRLHTPSDQTVELTEELRQRHRFFHWELEFPDVFRRASGPPDTFGGFDALVGNPPWEIQKPNSKEFFSNLDPLYRTYGKQEALARQTALFQARPPDEAAWIAYNADFKAMSNLVKNAASPFGDGVDGGATFSLDRNRRTQEMLQAMWSRHRQGRKGHADPRHPFRHQGSADLNTYKLFLEQAWRLLGPQGQLGLVVPSGVYTDKGTSGLRELFLDQGRWRWLFGFENREKIFPDVDGRFKFCPVIVQKGGRTGAIHTAFMQRNLADWEQAEHHAIPYSREQVLRFSPGTLAFLEIRDHADGRFVNRMHEASRTFGEFLQHEFGALVLTEVHKTNDHTFFLSKREVEGLRADAPVPDFRDPRTRAWLTVRDVYPVAEGKTVQMYDNAWAEPQILMDGERVRQWYQSKGKKRENLDLSAFMRPRIVFREVARNTDARSVIASLLPPCSITTYTLRAIDLHSKITWWLVGILNSFAFDLVTRLRGNYHLSTCYDLLPIPDPPEVLRQALDARVQALVGPVLGPDAVPYTAWAVAPIERSTARAEIEALAAAAFGLDVEDVRHVLKHDPDDPISFFRVDKGHPLECRLTTLSLLAFETLQEVGIGKFSAEFRRRAGDRFSPTAALSWEPKGGWRLAWEEAEANGGQKPTTLPDVAGSGYIIRGELPIAAERGRTYRADCAQLDLFDS